jgi:hypothetical protein
MISNRTCSCGCKNFNDTGRQLNRWRLSNLEEEMNFPIAANDNVNPDEPLRLKDAIEFGFPHGGMTVSGLIREAKAGRLVIEKIANKHFTTLRAIEEMRKSCRVKAGGRVSGGEKSGGKAERSLPKERGLLSMVDSITPQAALLARIDKRKNS